MNIQVESAIRRRANRAGYILKKDRAREWRLDHQGEYMLIDAAMNIVAIGQHFDGTLEEIADFLAPEEASQKAT